MNVREMKELSSKLKLLQSAWAEKFPNRARGGRIAIVGFRYQFYSFLHNLVYEWLSYSTDERNSIEKFLTVMESLSDITAITKDGVIIATQSKITLRTSSLNDALEEFKTIHKTAKEECHLALGELKYRILCSKIEVNNINKAILNWKKKQQSLNNEYDFTDCIEVISESSPENRLLSLLSNHLKCQAPFKLVHKWIGLIINGIDSYETMELIGKLIWDDLLTLMQSSIEIKDNIYLWQDIDVPPDDISKGPVLIGQRPSVYHLRNGYFSPRSKLYGIIEDNLLSLIESLSYSTSDKIPIYWIGGRSGSGKSVALLHVLSTIHEKGYGSVIWVGHQTSLLSAAVKYALELDNTSGIQIIGVDDPYVVGVENNVAQHWEEVFTILHSYRQNGNYKSLPIFIACGPTEQAYLFKDDYCEYLEFYIKELPQESNEEQLSIKNWYKERTGNEPPNIDDTNTLMVQQFFQWDRHQSIMDFAKRLRDRLILGDQSKVIYGLVSRILSLNRLYIGYAISAVKNNLTIEQRELLEWLERDIHLGEREQHGMNGYWLLHSHLANALYLNWYENKPAAYSEHLKAAILDSITYGSSPNEKAAPLWAVSRVFRQTHRDDLLKRIDENTAKSILIDIYGVIISENTTIVISMLPVWVEIYSLKPELNLSPSPIDIAIEAIKPCYIGETGLRLLCHKIMQYYNTFDFETQQRIARVIIEFLRDTYHWNEWIHIIKNAIVVLKDNRLIPIVISYLSSNSNNTTAELLYISAKEWPNNKDIINITMESLKDAPCTYFWVEIVRECIKNSNQKLNNNIIVWLQRHKDNRHLCFALKEGISRFYNEIHDIVIYWSSLWNHIDVASFVLEPLLDYESDNQKVIEWCCNWLIAGNGDKSFMLEILLKNRVASEVVVEIAINWLNSVSHQNPSWNFVWQALENVNISETTSLDKELQWLKENKIDDIKWPFFWINLSNNNPYDSMLIDLGTKWLKQQDMSHPLWGKIFRKLIDISPGDIQLTGLVQNWLKQKDISYTAWPYIWQNFYRNDSSNLELKNLAIRWLKEINISHSAWLSVWSAIIRNNPDDIEIFNIGINWLRKFETNNEKWRSVWGKLFNISPDNDELLHFGENWLKSVNYNTTGWYHVWKKMYKNSFTVKDSILEIGKIWLTKVNQENEGWVDIWDSVYKSDLSNIRLFNMGINFLRSVSTENGTWSNMWLLLIKAKPEDENLFMIGFEWINKTNRMQHGAWRNIWVSLTKSKPSNSDLYKIGIRWVNLMDLTNPSWQYIWMRLFDLKNMNSKELNLGLEWLKLKINVLGAWPEVFLRVKKSETYNTNLRSLGREWLSQVPQNTNSWSKVWLEIIKLEPHDKKLLELGYIWLKKTNKCVQNWPIIWSILAPFYKNDTYLFELALDWTSEYTDEHPYWEKIYNILDETTSGK
ncbi:hypothetical protein [Candidatus Clostridium stratigraminis]|uniref:ATP-binding protein n=1 Tax=Candidatus Clostridium stratigraminis TaxID=3381661 RepID=A0ABW8T688_9CLOT